MANTALLLGVKNDKRTIIDQGDPRDIRVKFKTAKSGEGFEAWEVIESNVGRTRRKTWSEKPVAESAPIDESTNDDDQSDTPKKRGRPSSK